LLFAGLLQLTEAGGRSQSESHDGEGGLAASALGKMELSRCLRSTLRGSGSKKEPHFFFGKMKPEEWAALNYQHLDHHLRQFGG